jgi:hypothetical protein
MLAACGGGSTTGTGTGTVAASITDAPSCGYDHVYVTVDKVQINSSTDGSGTWSDFTIPASLSRIDLLNLTNGALESLGQVALNAGTYQQLRLVLAPNVSGSATLSNAVVPSGQTTEFELKTPSAVQSGIKVNTRMPFTVAAGTLVDLVLDFNACKSIVTTGKGNGHGASGYLLKPVVTATPVVVSGSIDGYVDPADAGAMVFAEQNGVIVRGTVADSTGHFVLTPLEQSSGAGNYDVVIVNAGKASDIVTAVPVIAQSTTALSSAAIPFTLVVSTTGVVGGTVNPAALATLDAQQIVTVASVTSHYDVATTNADSATGVYGFTLATDAPLLGPYASSGIVLAPVAGAAGQYNIVATSAAGSTASAPVSVAAGGSVTVDFSNLQ